MKINCQHCGVTLNLPGDKLQPGAEFSFNCPKCKNKNTLRVPEREKTPPPSDRTEEAQGQGPPSPADLIDEAEEAGTMGEFYEEGAKPALICFDDGPLRKKVIEIAEDLGFVPAPADSSREALKRIRVTQYSAVFLHEEFDGQDLRSNAVLRFLQPMDMTLRRRIFLALFTSDYQSLDNMAAFALSVNAVVNLVDEDRFDKILYRAYSEYERFYKVYFDVMREMGKI